MWPFLKKSSFEIKVDKHRVYAQWYKPLKELGPADFDAYHLALCAAVRDTVDDDTYAIISSGSMWSDKKAHEYVEAVRKDLIAEYGFPDSTKHVWIGHYQMDMIVIGFVGDPKVTYPYFYKGIQLKPTVIQQDGAL